MPSSRPFPAAQALKDEVQGFQTLQVAVEHDYWFNGSRDTVSRDGRRHRGTLRFDADCRMAYDRKGGARISWDGERGRFHWPPRSTVSDDPIEACSRFGPAVEMRCKGLQDGSITWVARHPSEHGYMKPGNGLDYVELELPFAWAQGYHASLRFTGEGVQHLTVYGPPPENDRIFQVAIESVRANLDLPPQAFDPHAPPFPVPWPPPPPPPQEQ